MTPIRELPAGQRQAREIGREAYANDLTLYECREDIAHYYGKTWAEMSATEKEEAALEYKNGRDEERAAVSSVKICQECFQTYEDCECTEDDGTPIR